MYKSLTEKSLTELKLLAKEMRNQGYEIKNYSNIMLKDKKKLITKLVKAYETHSNLNYSMLKRRSYRKKRSPSPSRSPSPVARGRSRSPSPVVRRRLSRSPPKRGRLSSLSRSPSPKRERLPSRLDPLVPKKPEFYYVTIPSGTTFYRAEEYQRVVFKRELEGSRIFTPFNYSENYYFTQNKDVASLYADQKKLLNVNEYKNRDPLYLVDMGNEHNIKILRELSDLRIPIDQSFNPRFSPDGTNRSFKRNDEKVTNELLKCVLKYNLKCSGWFYSSEEHMYDEIAIFNNLMFTNLYLSKHKSSIYNENDIFEQYTLKLHFSNKNPDTELIKLQKYDQTSVDKFKNALNDKITDELLLKYKIITIK